ncbi:MAG: hypothetical protein ACRYE7_01015 [Janthinobacterium lividum]
MLVGKYYLLLTWKTYRRLVNETTGLRCSASGKMQINRRVEFEKMISTNNNANDGEWKRMS